MSIGEAIASSAIILVTSIVVASAAQTVSVTKEVDVPEVEIVWQQRLVHNAINNPYIALSDKETVTDPDRDLVKKAGFVPYSENTKPTTVTKDEKKEKVESVQSVEESSTSENVDAAISLESESGFSDPEESNESETTSENTATESLDQ